MQNTTVRDGTLRNRSARDTSVQDAVTQDKIAEGRDIRHPTRGRNAKVRHILDSCRNTAGEVVCETLWPARCSVCDKPGRLLCSDCEQRLPFIDLWHACPLCGAPYGYIQCTECNPVMLAVGGRKKLPFDRMASALVLNADTHRMITAYKDQGDRRLSSLIAKFMAAYVSPYWLEGHTVGALTFIPASPASRCRRGFDHAEKLAEEVARELGLVSIGLFSRPRSIDQRRLSRAQRAQNMAHCLKLQSCASPPKRIIVIDDVCTTGSTLYAAADVLRNHGAEKIYGLTFARVWN